MESFKRKYFPNETYIKTKHSDEAQWWLKEKHLKELMKLAREDVLAELKQFREYSANELIKAGDLIKQKEERIARLENALKEISSLATNGSTKGTCIDIALRALREEKKEGEK